MKVILYPARPVTGVFSGDIDLQEVEVTTVVKGAARFRLLTETFPDYTFCVAGVDGPLPYNPDDNVDPSFDCSGLAISSKSESKRDELNVDKTLSASSALPTEFSLDQNYPNPFNPSTLISYAVPEAGKVSVRAYNMLGQEVVTLVDSYIEAGYYQARFDAGDLPAGVYLYVMQTENYRQAMKMTLLK